MRILSMMSKVVPDQPPRAPDGSWKGSDKGVGAGAASDERVYNMRIDREGVWHHEGRPIARQALVKLFASVLERDPDGGHRLVTPAEHGPIEVEDAPFVIVALAAEGSGSDQILRVKSNLDDWVTIGPDHPLTMRLPKDGQSDVPLPYVDMRAGLEARLLRSVYYQLVELGDSHAVNRVLRYGVWSSGRFFPLD